MPPEIVDFDNIDEWATSLHAFLRPLVTGSVKKKMIRANPSYVEDTRDLFFELAGRDEIIDAVLAWLNARKIVGYHGTRLNDSETVSVSLDGLIPETLRPMVDKRITLKKTLKAMDEASPRWRRYIALTDTMKFDTEMPLFANLNSLEKKLIQLV